MRGPKPRTVAFRTSGWVHHPPIDKTAAETAYGTELPEEVWTGIKGAFVHFGDICNMLDGPRLNQNRNDPRSYILARQNAEADVDSAADLIANIASDWDMTKTFAIASMMRPGGALYDGELEDALEAAAFALRRAKMILNRAVDPPAVAVTEPDARKELAQRIVTLLGDWGLDIRRTTWAASEFPGGMSEADMTPVERLLSALGVHEAACPESFVRWLWSAAPKK